MRFARAADHGPRLRKRPPSDRRKNFATIHGRVPGTCTDKTHTSYPVLGGLRERARLFRLVSCRFGAASVRLAQRNIYRVREDGGCIGRPGAHNLQCFRYLQTVTYFPVSTSAPGTLWTTKPPPGGPNCVPGSLTYPFDTVVTTDRRPGGLGPRQGLGLSSRTSAGPKAVEPARNASWSLFRWDEEPATPIAGHYGTNRTPPGPWAPT